MKGHVTVFAFCAALMLLMVSNTPFGPRLIADLIEGSSFAFGLWFIASAVVFELTHLIRGCFSGVRS